MTANRIVNRSTEITARTTFGDIVVPDELRRVNKSGIPEIDVLFAGEGIRPSTVALLTGLPGAGKTTLSLQLACALAGMGHIVQYNSCEESLEQLKMNIERMNLPASINKVHPSSFSEVNEILDHANSIKSNHRIARDKGFFLFIDSLQTIEKAREEGLRGRNHSQANQAVIATWDISNWCKETYNTAIIIGQVTKDGEFAGKNELKHAIDCHLHMAIDKDRQAPTYGERFITATKNRFGATGIDYYYTTGRAGITFTGDIASRTS